MEYTFSQTRRYVISSQVGLCYYCGKPIDEFDCVLHHKVSVCDGGTNEADNLAAVHFNCHSKLHEKRNKKNKKKRLRQKRWYKDLSKSKKPVFVEDGV